MSRAVIAVPRGGLGNQLFTVAAALLVASSGGRQVHVDMRQAAHAEPSGFFALERLIPLCCGSAEAEIKPSSPLGNRHWLSLNRRLANLHPVGGRMLQTFVEKRAGFDPTVLSIKPPRRLFGYFQSYRYVEELENRQGALVVENRRPTQLFERLEAKMLDDEPLTVHLRRGDYQFHPVFGTLPLHYYHEAIEVLKERVGNRPMWVFSDDPVFARQSFKEAERVIGAELDAAETMILMSRGTGIAIANSSLSWWAAWLSGRPSLVAAPAPWFRGKTVDLDSLMPRSWMRISSGFLIS